MYEANLFVLLFRLCVVLSPAARAPPEHKMSVPFDAADVQITP